MEDYDEPVDECENCAEELFVGDTAYKIDGKCLCEDCFVEFAKNKFSFEVEPPADPRDEREWDE